MSRIGCMPEPSFTRLGTTLRAPWGSVRLASDAERPGAGAPAGLQNRSAGVTRRWVGSIPAPLRSAGRRSRERSVRICTARAVAAGQPRECRISIPRARAAQLAERDQMTATALDRRQLPITCSSRKERRATWQVKLQWAPAAVSASGGVERSKRAARSGQRRLPAAYSEGGAGPGAQWGLNDTHAHPPASPLRWRLTHRARGIPELQPEYEFERVVDRALLVWIKSPDAFSETFDVDDPKLLDQHPRQRTRDDDRRPERRRRGAARGRSDDRGRQSEERVRLHDYAVPGTALLTTAATGQPDPEHVTACHSGQSADTASRSAINA